MSVLFSWRNTNVTWRLMVGVPADNLGPIFNIFKTTVFWFLIVHFIRAET